MGFGQEISDFVSGMKAGAEVGAKSRHADAVDELTDLKSGKESDEDRAAIDAQVGSAASSFRGSAIPSAAGSGGGSGGSGDGAGTYNAGGKAPAFTGGQDEFIQRVMPAAMQASKDTGIDPRLIVAQAAHESGWGAHAPGNNLFGIKAHGQGGGPALATTEVVNGMPVKTTASFRTYKSPEDSVAGWASFIKSNPRYAPVTNAQGLDAQIAAMGKSGYATDPAYATKLRAIASRIPMGTGSATANAGAIPMPPARPDDIEMASAQDEEEDPRTQAFADGGYVRDPNEDAPLPPARPADVTQAGNSAIPSGPGQTWGPEQAAAARENTTDNRGAGGSTGYNPQQLVDADGAAHAAHDGLTFIQKVFGLNPEAAAIPAASPDRQAGMQAFSRNEGAASPAEVRQVDQTIDPKNELSGDQRSMARLYAGWNYYVQKGEPERAQRYAASMLMYGRVHSMMGGQLALQAIQSGDVARGAAIIQEASAENPTGESIKVLGVGPDGAKYQTISHDGQVQAEGVAAPQQLAQMAIAMRNGSAWTSQMTQLGGSRGTRGPAGPKPMTEAQTAKAAQDQADRKAITDFDSESDSEMLASFTDKQRDAFASMTPRLQAAKRKEWSENYKRQKDDAKTESTRQKAEKKAGEDQEFAGYSAKHQDALERYNAQKAQDDQDGVVSPEQQKLAEEVNATRKATRDWATTAGRPDLVKDKTFQAVPMKPGKGVDAQKVDGAAPAVAQDLVRADAAWNKRTKGKDVDPADVDNVVTELGKQVATPDKPLDPTSQIHYQTSAVDIVHANSKLTAPQAVQIVRQAVDGSGKFTVKDGRVSFDGGPPVYISQDGLNAIATLRKQKVVAPTTDQGGSGPGDPGSTPFQASSPAALRISRQETDSRRAGDAERAQAIRTRIPVKQSEQQEVQAQLGDDYRAGMSLPDMRRALRDRARERELNNPTAPGAIPMRR